MSERLKRVFLVRDCSANWFEHVPGCLEDGAWRFYAKHPGWFATDLEGMVDWCVADRIVALLVSNFWLTIGVVGVGYIFTVPISGWAFLRARDRYEREHPTQGA